MTLRRQLTFIIAALFVLLFMGSFAINVHNTRAYLNDQLNSISQDMATSLGLTLSPYMAEDDMVVVESHVNALYDSGYYQEIVISDIDGHAIIERISNRPIEKVPSWFVKLFPLQTPRGESLIMSGWTQAGSVRVSAHPEFAYVRLWAACVQSFYLFVIGFVTLFGLVMVVLHYVLRPLKALEQQAEAISNRHYVVQSRLPWTKELREVVSAMNMMSTKIRDIFSQQDATLERIRNAAYTDPTTGLPNRTYFNMRLHHLLDSDTDFEQGALIFAEISHLVDLNRQSGHLAGDNLLKRTGQIIREQIAQFPANDTLIARLSGTTFAIVISGIAENQTEKFVLQLTDELAHLHAEGVTPFKEVVHIGVTFYRNQTFAELLSEADMALRAAQIKGPNAVHCHHSHLASEFDSLTATQWIALLNRVIEEKRFSLLLQPVMKGSDPGSVKQQEVLLRIVNDNDKLIPAGLFIPLIHHHGLAKTFDRMIVTAVFGQLASSGAPDVPIAINLMAASIADPEFIAWLSAELASRPDLSGKILFELDDYGVLQNPLAAHLFQQTVSAYGISVGIDHFGRNMTALSALGSLKPDYLKIDGSFTRHIDAHKDNQQFVEVLVNAAHAQDMKVIAESIEHPAEVDMLIRLRVDGLQGYALSRPHVWIAYPFPKENVI